MNNGQTENSKLRYCEGLTCEWSELDNLGSHSFLPWTFGTDCSEYAWIHGLALIRTTIAWVEKNLDSEFQLARNRK